MVKGDSKQSLNRPPISRQYEDPRTTNKEDRDTLDGTDPKRRGQPKSRRDGKESPNRSGTGSGLYGDLTQELKEMKRLEGLPLEEEDEGEEEQEYDEPPKPESKGLSCFNLLIALFAIIGGILSYHIFDGQRFFQQSSGSVIMSTKWQTFQNEFQNFENIYSEVIPKKGFKILNTSVGKVLNRTKSSETQDKSSPAIVLIIASEDKKNILKCVERDFVNSVNKAYNENNVIVINGKQTSATDIVDKFDQNFRDQQKHTIIIEDMESISPNDVMSLHQFTDHENAKYKDVIIVLTAIHYQKYSLTKTANPREMDSIASQLLEIKWKNALPGEQSFALISRLTPSVVTIIGPTEGTYNC